MGIIKPFPAGRVKKMDDVPQEEAKPKAKKRPLVRPLETPPLKSSTVKKPGTKLTLPTVTFADIKKDWSLFATESSPLRSSVLKFFCECPMKYLHELGDSFVANDKMQTGSAVHYLIERHELTKEEATEKDFKSAFAEWTLADEDLTREYYQGYVKRRDEFGEVYGNVVGIERQYIAKIAPSPLDKTGKEIVIGCTLDQERLKAKDGVENFNIIDFKVSTASIADSVKTYALQLSAYIVAVSQAHPKAKVHAHIANPILMSKPRSLSWFPAGISVQQADKLLDVVRGQVAMIRNGTPSRIPGYGCLRCKVKNPSRC